MEGLWFRVVSTVHSLSWDSLGVDILGWSRYVWHYSSVRLFWGGHGGENRDGMGC